MRRPQKQRNSHASKKTVSNRIDRLDSEGMLIRTWIKTQPLQQWNVVREFRRRLKLALEEAGIDIGLPHHAIAWNRRISQRSDGKRHNNFIAN